MININPNPFQAGTDVNKKEDKEKSPKQQPTQKKENPSQDSQPAGGMFAKMDTALFETSNLDLGALGNTEASSLQKENDSKKADDDNEDGDLPPGLQDKGGPPGLVKKSDTAELDSAESDDDTVDGIESVDETGTPEIPESGEAEGEVEPAEGEENEGIESGEAAGEVEPAEGEESLPEEENPFATITIRETEEEEETEGPPGLVGKEPPDNREEVPEVNPIREAVNEVIEPTPEPEVYQSPEPETNQPVEYDRNSEEIYGTGETQGLDPTMKEIVRSKVYNTISSERNQKLGKIDHDKNTVLEERELFLTGEEDTEITVEEFEGRMAEMASKIDLMDRKYSYEYARSLAELFMLDDKLDVNPIHSVIPRK